MVVDRLHALALVSATLAVSRGETMRLIEGCGRSSFLAEFHHSRRHHAIDCGRHAMGYNGRQRDE